VRVPRVERARSETLNGRISFSGQEIRRLSPQGGNTYRPRISFQARPLIRARINGDLVDAVR